MITLLLFSLISFKVSSRTFSCDVNVDEPRCATDSDCESGYLCGTRLTNSGVWVALGNEHACAASCRCYCLAIEIKTANPISNVVTNINDPSETVKTGQTDETNDADNGDDANETGKTDESDNAEDANEPDDGDNGDDTSDTDDVDADSKDESKDATAKPKSLVVTPCTHHTTDSNSDSVETTSKSDSGDSGDYSSDSDDVLSAVWGDHMRDSQLEQEHEVYVLLGNIWILIISVVVINVIVLCIWCAFKRSKKAKKAFVSHQHMLSDQEVEEQRCDVHSDVSDVDF